MIALLLSLPYLMALLLGLGIPAGLMLLAHLGRRWPDQTKLATVLTLMVLAPAIGIAVSGRVLHTDYELQLNPALAFIDKESPLASWANRIGTVIILAICLSEVLRWLMGQRTMSPQARRAWVAVHVYYIVLYGLAGAAGDNTRFISLHLIYMPIVFTALALFASSLSPGVLRAVSWGIRMVLVGTIVGALVLPNTFMQRDYASLIPGIGIRLVGPFDHANTMGCLAMLALVLELSREVHPRRSWMFLGIAAGNLVAAQSKTTWAAVALILLMMQATSDNRTDRHFAAFKRWSSLCWLLAAVLCFLGLAAHKGWISDWATVVSGFTGRDKIWDITLTEFERSPFLGYGPGLWDYEYRLDRSMLYVGQAHNQFVQTLGQAGALGITALLAYLAVLLSQAWQGMRQQHQLAALCLLIVLVRCQMETPLVMNSIIGVDTLLHGMAFVLCAGIRPTARSLISDPPPPRSQPLTA